MDHYGPDPDFGIKLFGLIGGMLLIIFVFNTIMRKVLRVERKKIFSQNHINELHKKADWSIRIAYIVIAIVSIFIFNFNNQLLEYSAWVLLGLAVVFLILEEGLRAIMEYKFKKGQNDYLLTIYQLIFWLAAFYFSISSEGFGLFNLW